jgi:uncharacterized delta-60 repeat protein
MIIRITRNDILFILYIFLFFSTNSRAQIFQINADFSNPDGFHMGNYGFGNLSQNFRIFPLANDEYISVGVSYFNPTEFISGDSRIFISRLHSDGSIDSSFGDDGIINTGISIDDGYGLRPFIQMTFDEKLLIYAPDSTQSSGALKIVRFNSDGTLDMNFNSGGSPTLYFPDTAVKFGGLLALPDGKIIIHGCHDTNNFNNCSAFISRLNLDGTLDSSFAEMGTKIIAFSNSDYTCTRIIRDNEASYYALLHGVQSTDSLIVLKLNATGGVDYEFGEDGMLKLHHQISEECIANGVDLLFDPEGSKIVLITQEQSNPGVDIVIRRFDTLSGELDTSIGSMDGWAQFDIGECDHIGAPKVISDGKILALGNSENFLSTVIEIDLYADNIDTLFNAADILEYHLSSDSLLHGYIYGYDYSLETESKIVMAGFIYSLDVPADTTQLEFLLLGLIKEDPNLSDESTLYPVHIKVKPNPFNDRIIVDYVGCPFCSILKLAILNNLGERVFETELHNVNNTGELPVSIPESLRSGVYYLQMQCDASSIVVKIIKTLN